MEMENFMKNTSYYSILVSAFNEEDEIGI